MPVDFPSKYLRFNSQQAKNLTIVVEIPGIDLLSNRNTIFTKVRYGDVINNVPIKYGDPGLVYGGLRKVDNVRDYLSLEKSSMTIAQKLEPEQGRGAISTLSLSFIDKDQYMTQAVSPGILIPEIMNRQCTVYMGYQETSFPDDYVIIFRGRISNVDCPPGMVSLQISDPNVIRRQNVFTATPTKLAFGINAAQTNITVLDNSNCYVPILGPNGQYDSGVTTYLKINDEYMIYAPTGIGSNTFTVTRGARGTTPSTANAGDDVTFVIEIEDHAIDMALKLMLSGWNGNWTSGVEVLSIVKTLDGTLLDQEGAIILPLNKDANGTYGLVPGDYVTISGATNPANNVTGKIIRFAPLQEQDNRIIYIDQTLVVEYPTTATLSFRSQFDTYPTICGVKLTPQDVDVQGHIDLKNTFLIDQSNAYRFLMSDSESCKTFIELEIYLPVAAYSLTKRGRLSVGYTHPPIANESLLILDNDTVIDPSNLKVSRGLNNRKWFNEVDFSFDVDDNGNFTSFFDVLDSDAINQMQATNILPIQSRGARTDLGTSTLFPRRGNFLLSRYKKPATIIDTKTNWEIGCQIEAGDVVAIVDNGDLQIPNFQTGERQLNAQLFEVLNRSLDLKNGNVSLQLINGIASELTDRYATISPSSFIVDGDDTFIKIIDSYGAQFPGNESRKWQDYIGQRVIVHDDNYTFVSTTTLTGIDPADNYKLFISGFDVLPPSFSNVILDIPHYPDDGLKATDALYKVIHCYTGPEVAVVSGASDVQFDVGAGDIAKFFVGGIVRVHNEDFSQVSGDIIISQIVGNTIVLAKSMGFTPDNTFSVSGIGFSDKGAPYRFI
jgi:hypothetical protein